MRYGWSLVKCEWNRLPSDLLNERIWQSVQLTIVDLNAVPEHAGVYLICTLVPGRRRSNRISPNDLFGIMYTAIYVGISDNIRERFKRHCNNPDERMSQSRECFGDSLDFWFTRLESNQLGAIETYLIDCLGPPANKIRGSLKGALLEPISAKSGL